MYEMMLSGIFTHNFVFVAKPFINNYWGNNWQTTLFNGLIFK